MTNNENPKIKDPYITNSLRQQLDKRKEERFLPMLHGKATDALAAMPQALPQVNAFSGNYALQSGEITLTISGKPQALGVSAHKLLSAAIAVFTENNHTGKNRREVRSLEVSIPFKEYARRCGLDVDERPTRSAAAAKEERKRVKTAIDNARKKIQRDLATLRAADLSWRETVKGKDSDFRDIGLIQEKGIEDGNIKIVLGSRLANYLIQLPITQYPLSLLSLDERNKNAYNMGYQMSLHYGMTSNKNFGTESRLKVKTLLSYTALPSPTSPSVKKNGWQSRIKDRLEESLEALKTCGLLEDWEYCKPKGAALRDEQAETWEDLNEAIDDNAAATWDSFYEWANTLVRFTLKDAPPIKEDRLEDKAAAKHKKDK